MQKITPHLWFDSQAEEAAQFYVSIFENSRIVGRTRYDATAAPIANKPIGSVMTVTFELSGQEFIALNGGPIFQFSEAVSFLVRCDSQQEVDSLWARLTEGGHEMPCGWLKDKFGVSWQIVPTALEEMLGDEDEERRARVFHALLQMTRIDIAGLRRAFDGDS